MAGGNQRIEPRLSGVQQRGYRRPRQPARQQQQQVVGDTLLQHGRDRCGRGLEAGHEKHHGTLWVGFGDAHRFDRRRDRADVGTGRLGLFQTANVAFRYIHGYPQHVAERQQTDVFMQCQLDRLIDIFFRTDTDRTTGAGD